VLQAMQMDLRHISEAMGKLTTVSEKQADLGHELQRHSDSIQRAFTQMDGHKSELVKSIDKLTETIGFDRGEAQKLAAEVIGFKGAIRGLKWACGGMAALIIAVCSLFATNVNSSLGRTDQSVAQLRDDMKSSTLAHDLKIDGLSQAVQEVRLNRQRDVEAKGAAE
jgi:hypothetical protein